MSRSPPERRAPSVIVPTLDRPGQLAACLDCLARQTLVPGETIVVDDGGSVDLAPALSRFGNRLDLRLLRQANGGPASARNLGLRHASSELVAFTDDDCLPEEDWLERLLAAWDGSASPAMVGGAIFNTLARNSFSEASQLILDLVYDHYNSDPAAARFVVTMNLLAPREVLLEAGGFDATFRTAEDRELCDRWLAAGHRLIYAPQARVGHAHALDVGSFCRQHFGYGRGADRYHRIRAARASGSLLEESSFHVELPRLLARRARAVGRLRMLSLMPHLAAWQLTNAAGFLWSRGRRRG